MFLGYSIAVFESFLMTVHIRQQRYIDNNVISRDVKPERRIRRLNFKFSKFIETEHPTEKLKLLSQLDIYANLSFCNLMYCCFMMIKRYRN